MKSCCPTKSKSITFDILVKFVQDSKSNKTGWRKRLKTVKEVLRAEDWSERQIDKWVKENKLV